jgi:hypothetical protein
MLPEYKGLEGCNKNLITESHDFEQINGTINR